MLLQNQLRDLGSTADDHLDLTPMVDTVFQLLTFLLLTYQVSAESAVNMPPAKHGIGVEEVESLVLTVSPAETAGAPALVYWGTKRDPDKQLADSDRIQQKVEEAVAGGKRRVVIQADGDVTHGEVLRVAGAAGKVEGITIHVGVEEPR
jgi:biopolymer transport protein ExbD